MASWSRPLQDHLAVEEGTLWSSAVDLLWLNDQERSILKEVVYYQLADSVVLKSAFYYALFEISVKSQYL